MAQGLLYLVAAMVPSRLKRRVKSFLDRNLSTKANDWVMQKFRRLETATSGNPSRYSAAVDYHGIYRQGFLARNAASASADLKADAYICLLPSTLPAAFEMQRLHGGRVFCDNVENIDVDKHSLAPRKPLHVIQMTNALARGAMLSCDGLLTVSDALANTLHPFGRPVHVLKNYRSFECPESTGLLRRELGLKDTDILLFASGNVVIGFEPIVDAMAELPPHFHLVAFVRLKPADYEHSIRNRIAKLGLASRIHIRPFVPYEQLASFAAEAQIGLITSDTANPNGAVALPNRLFDYITGGLPVAAPPMPDVKSILDNFRCGICVEATTPSEWKSAITSIASDLNGYRIAAANARNVLTWESQEAAVAHFIGDPGSVTFFSFRDLTRYQRHIRLAKTFLKQGRTVNFAFFSEDPDVSNLVPGVRYFVTDDRYGIADGFREISPSRKGTGQ